ncbi:50S ribosomal protein L5 [Anaerococcus prevotii]|uniref:Large ribosomal subunit protein uL5 n=1 Tax=Anaerococcus prevotii (strain ATCC 9321 / DSM 20548 / JCM 6508 / NCTC 11806 / PC1) TaxID=525919 RepID=C7REH0_ANAPD|nr:MULTISPECIES: 50S ribosomal protein L5 [Anaerococcus]ACV29583.1 ribosomal protein L5 [Anaerococcus prevotii DSM 20548]SUU95257.1 50S ribosomal protein L5 [Anaerococcus prevotii]
MTSRLKEKYQNEVVGKLTEQFGYENVHQVPKLTKIVINVGLGEAKDNQNLLNAAKDELALITGQRPIELKAKKSVANFKLREGQAIGTKVTLRREKMYDFLDKLISISLPRVRDFRGINPNSFDGRGNYSLGIKEQLIFPEIKYDDVDFLHGMDISIVTTAETDEEAKAFLELMGMPFRK